MAIVKPGQQEAEAQEMAAAFGEDIPPPAEQTDDEAFGLTPPDQAGGETPGADTATVTADSGGEEVPAEGAPAEMPEEGGELPADPGLPAEPSDGEAEISPEDEQRAKSWEGRLRKREEDLAAREAELKAMEERVAGGEAADEGESAAEEMAEMESPGGDADDMAGSEFESPEQAVAWATENFGPEFVKVIDLIVESRIKSGMGDVDSRLSGVLQRIEDRDVRDHFREIARAKPDFLSVVKSAEFGDWRAGHEQADHYAQVMQDGTADDVIAMLQAFDDSQNQVDGTIVDDAAEGVRSTGAGLVLPEEAKGAADDYLSAFKEFASED